jgi:Trk K+ transport system NAD-binding subunit
MPPEQIPDAQRPLAIIAGYGIPGRAARAALIKAGYECVVIEFNATTVNRMGDCGAGFICGDASHAEVLQRAGIDRAVLVVVAVPLDPAALAITRQAKRLNPKAQIITRCQFISGGLEAKHLGANEVVIAEQVVATALEAVLPKSAG